MTNKNEKNITANVTVRENETLTEVNDGIKLIQNKNGLTYGTDALLLSAFIRRFPSGVAAEFGSGTGIISLLLASRKKLGKIYAVEAQEYYAELTARNAELNGLADTVEAICADVRDLRGDFDVVFTNPPYMRSDSGKRNADDGKYAARHEVFGGIGDFCRSAAKVLKFGGLFYCVYRPDRAIDLFCAMRESGIEPKRFSLVYPSPTHKPCLLLVEGKRGAMPSCDAIEPLILYENASSEMTENAKKIYDTGDWF